jgi:hypothetical protein
MIKRLVRATVPAFALALAIGLSGCAATHSVKENSDADITVSWVNGTTCKIKGFNRSGNPKHPHWMPSNDKPGIYDTKVCRGGEPVKYILWYGDSLQVEYKVTYTITDKVDTGLGGCKLYLTPRDRGWAADIVERGRCGKLKKGGTYTQEKASEEAKPISYLS